ncbi:hypothetical protein LZ31DRAFT_599387 [Colletotrichum somersetense]|nr:hypothetical protein LZ31DRAFT_599387 [Colletotrichum somersetense]
MRPDLKATESLMSRFPARQPSASQNAARLRDNQRRHRARVKAHTAELEAQLAETKARLDAALDEIARLAGQVESLRRGSLVAEPSADPGRRRRRRPDSPARETRAHPRPERAAEAPTPCDGGASRPSFRPFGGPVVSGIADPSSVQEGASAGEPDVPGASLPAVRASSPAAAARLPRVSGPPTRDEPPRPRSLGNCDRDRTRVDGEAHAAQPDVLAAMMSGRGCEDLPAPQSGESTAQCTDAYNVIEQLNFSGLDVGEITRRLKPGFRKAVEKGGGCRVNTQLLFALLDYISSTNGL